MDDGFTARSATCQRLVQVPLDGVEATALRLVPEETWGELHEARVFAFEPLTELSSKLPPYPDGPTFAEVRARADPHDLEAPDNGLEKAWANANVAPPRSRQVAGVCKDA